MKRNIIFILLFTNQLFGQTIDSKLFEVSKPFKKVYIDITENFILVFDMGKYLDKAGIGTSIRKTDTLFLQNDKSYLGKEFKIVNVNEQLYLYSLTEKKNKKYKLNKVQNISLAYGQLNNAYYLDSYFAMTDRLNKKYSLKHHDFRVGFYNWKELPNKEVDYSNFRIFTDSLIQKTEDSLSLIQEKIVRQTDFIITSIEKLSYQEFKDNIISIPAEFPYQSSYYKAIINKIAGIKPEYVISLYKEFPENRTLIEFAIENDKKLLKKLKAEQKIETALTKKK